MQIIYLVNCISKGYWRTFYAPSFSPLPTPPRPFKNKKKTKQKKTLRNTTNTKQSINEDKRNTRNNNHIFKEIFF